MNNIMSTITRTPARLAEATVALSPEEVDIIIDALQTWSAALSEGDEHVAAESPNAAYTHAMDALANRLVTVRGTV
jgi:hypothetical protein